MRNSLIIVGVVASAILSSCGVLDGRRDGFTGYQPCGSNQSEECVLVTGTDPGAKTYDIVVVAETPEEIRIRVDASGSSGTDVEDTIHVVDLTEPLGDRTVVDDITGEPVPLDLTDS